MCLPSSGFVVHVAAGPLSAVVRAQASAARSTVNFINTVGFYDNQTAITVDFSYISLNATSGEKIKTVLTIPQLAMVPVPFIRVRSLQGL